jgi:uncharacterized paraquat-inducible protein A
MNNLRYKLAQFMYGRNGVDKLGYAIMALYFIVFVANYFVNTIFLTALGFLFVVLMFYRIFSRDTVRRRSENERFMRVFNKSKSFLKQKVQRIKEFRTHRYRTCPGCKVTLRLPVKRGTHTVVCPRCKQRIRVRVWI